MNLKITGNKTLFRIHIKIVITKGNKRNKIVIYIDTA